MSAKRDFLALALAQTFSISGTRLSLIALPWLVLTLTGDPVLTGVVVFAEMAPYVLAKALGGPLIDRLGPRRIAMAGDGGAMVAVALVPLLSALEALSVTTLVPLVALLGALRGPADAAKQALVPQVARRAGLPLERVTGVVGTIERLASTLGAGAAGALVALLGADTALILNAATFGLSALIVLVGIAPVPPVSETNAPAGYGAQLKEGLTFLRGDAVLMGIATMVALTNLFDQAYATVLVPVWAQHSGEGPAVIGMVFAVMAGFSVLGALCATAYGERLPRLAIYIGAFVIIGVPRFAVFAFDIALPGILATLALAGFASGFLNPIISAVIFERIPERLVGRVSALVTASAWTLMPFGGLVGGALIAGLGLNVTFLGVGIAYFAITLSPVFLKRFRAFSDRPAALSPAR